MPELPIDVLADFFSRLRERNPLFLGVWANVLADWGEGAESTIENLALDNGLEATEIILCIGFGAAILADLGIKVGISGNQVEWEQVSRTRKLLLGKNKRNNVNPSGKQKSDIVAVIKAKPEKEQTLWEKMIAEYLLFLERYELPTVGLHQSNFKALHNIREKLRQKSEEAVAQKMNIVLPLDDNSTDEVNQEFTKRTESGILYGWKSILERWGEFEPWIQEKKNIAQIDYNFNQIFEQLIRNGRPIKQSHGAAIERAERTDFGHLARNRAKGS